MNAFKSPVARLAHLFQRSRDAWKAKALERQQRLRAAQVKIRDLEHNLRALEGACAEGGAGSGCGCGAHR